MVHSRRASKATKFKPKSSTSKKVSRASSFTSKLQVSKFLTKFKPTKKKRASKASAFTSKKSSKKFSLIKAKQPKLSLVSPFLTRFKSTSQVSKFAKSRGKRPKSVFITNRKISKDTPEISSFFASTSSPTFKTRKVGKSKVFSTARLSAKPSSLIVTFDERFPGGVPGAPTTPKNGALPSTPKNGVSFPSTPEPTSGDDTSIFDDIADFFSNFFGGSSGGVSSQERASDGGTTTSINFSPVTLPSQNIPDTDEGILDIEPRESFGLGVGGVSTDEGGDKDGILNSIVNDPIKLGLSIIAIIGGIAGFTGGK